MEPISEDLECKISPYLPQPKTGNIPFITLTYAQSLDSRISAEPGTRTVISHQQTKIMTHYIRHHHDAILVGISTVLADNPSLNCRYMDHSMIQPVIVDPSFKFQTRCTNAANRNSKLLDNLANGSGLKPIVVISTEVYNSLQNASSYDTYVELLPLDLVDGGFYWPHLFSALHSKFAVKSIMVEGGAVVINSLLNQLDAEQQQPIVDSLIITVGPVFLGNKGVEVSPKKPLSLQNVSWWSGIQDSVIFANLK